MSTDFSIKPVGAPAAAPLVQPSSAAAHNAVATDLPARQSVTAADAGSGVRNDTPDLGEQVSHQAFIDQAAATIVYQVVDKRTAMVVDQYPDEAVLRRRAYFHTIELQKDETPHVQPTDRTA
jgi:hypothetical protein